MARANSDDFYHFTVFYDSAVPGVFTYNYTATGGVDSNGAMGGTASVGTQGLAASGEAIAVQYSYDDMVVKDGLVVRCDTSVGKGTCVKVS